jgi:lysozyme family protein
LGPLGHYGDVLKLIQVPIVVQATICEREDGNDFTKNPAQGDPWNRPSIHVPRNRGPFNSWVEAAVDAWSVCDKLNVNSQPWSLPYACFKWEGYNGFGYRAHGVRTPYVVGGTNLQQPGKFVADGSFDPSHIDSQLGCLPIAVRMIQLVPGLAFGDAVMVAAAPSIIPAPTPLPSMVGTDLTGVKWVQGSLNRLTHAGLTVDGSFGRMTRAAIRDFQQAHGLTPDGYVTDNLCHAIDAELDKLPS